MQMADKRLDMVSALRVSKVSNSRAASLLTYLIPPLLSAALLILAFPRYNLGWLGWVALVPLFFAISARNAKYGFFQAFLCGMIFFAVVFDWVFEVPRYTLLNHLILCVYMSLYFGLFGLVFSLLCKRFGVTIALFTAPFIWVFLEYIRSNMGFMAMPYACLGHTKHAYPLVIQIASVAGAYGVSLLLAMVNSAVAACVIALLYRSINLNPRPNRPISNRGIVSIAAAAAFLVILVICYGIIVVSRPTMGKKVRVSVVQGNIEQEKKWDRRHAAFIMETYVGLTRKALRDQPDLIVWPEAATPRALSQDQRLYFQVKHLAEEAGVPLLLGSSSHQKFDKGRSREIELRNSAFLIGPDPRGKNQQYDKIHLLPFGEYLPYRETIPWSWIDVPNVTSTMPGKEFTVFQCPNFRFSAPICWEIIFPDLAREFVKSGAQLLINITNEAWFGRSVGPQHYVISSVFRAVENRVYVVRCANTGISCFIDPYGRIAGRVKDENNEDLFVRGVLTETIIPMESRTAYTRYGDWLVWICVGVSLVLTIVAVLRRKSDTETPTSGKILDFDQLMYNRKRGQDESTPYSS
jgi:apolipoprotein N-acyltransferase